ncbi:hypothetical protein ACGFR8_07755 [Streptomyces brevispora]|uniref:hypothetical protein n=1 Tax=Streptomyces brevispora TaxID=887462 RepID=UPI00371B291C
MAEEVAFEEEAQRVFDALDGLAAMDDPAAQARAISRVLKEQPKRNQQLKAIRRNYVLDQRAAKVPYRTIATQLGVSAGTVQDIERGYSGSGRDRPKMSRKKTDDDDPGEQ